MTLELELLVLAWDNYKKNRLESSGETWTADHDRIAFALERLIDEEEKDA